MKKSTLTLSLSLLLLCGACGGNSSGNKDSESVAKEKLQELDKVDEATIDQPEYDNFIADDIEKQELATLPETDAPIEYLDRDQDPYGIYLKVETQPEFPGGSRGLANWLQSHIQYPASALEQGIGGEVYAKLVIEKDGTPKLSEIMSTPDKAFDKEVERLVKEMPKWQPGKIKGKPVSCYYIVPVNFSLP